MDIISETYKRDCYDFRIGKQKENKKHKVSITLGETDDSDSDGEALVTRLAVAISLFS